MAQFPDAQECRATIPGRRPLERATLLEVGAVMFLVQDNDRKRRQRRKRQHDLGAVAVMAGIEMMPMTVVMFVVVSAKPMPVVMLIVPSVLPMPVLTVVVATRVVLVSVATTTMSPIRGECRRGEGQGNDQQCDSNSLGAIHGLFSLGTVNK